MKNKLKPKQIEGENSKEIIKIRIKIMKSIEKINKTKNLFFLRKSTKLININLD